MKHIGAVAGFALFVLTGCEAASEETVGPRGGTVVSDDGRFSLEIPEGALDTEVQIRIHAVECEPETAVGPCYEVTPRGMGFHVPAVVTYELGGMKLDALDPHRLNVIAERDEGWNVLADRIVDLDDELLSASAMYLSSYAIVTM
jgi:hypothetical protein